jgi:ParB family transcriptional regulator, chromosome partitioning protein
MTKKKSVTNQQPTLPISKIQVPENIREPGWEKNLDSLVSSIKASGLKQPVGVWPLPPKTEGPNGETHELVWGQRRLAACKKLKWTTIPVVFESSKSSARDRFMSSLAENDGRENISAYEEALAFQRGIEEFGMTASEIAQRKGVAAGYVSQRLTMLKMPDEVQQAVKDGEIKPTHVRELAKVKDEKEQKKLLKYAKKMPVSEFKDKVAESVDASADGDSSKKTKRGRPEKTSTAKVRTVSEIKIELGRLDIKKKEAVEKSDNKGVEYLKGMMRGLGWTAGLTKTLY